MLAEHRKNAALIGVRKVEEAVPCEQAVEAAAQTQRPHVDDLRRITGKIVRE
jgi:hypothetical protein